MSSHCDYVSAAGSCRRSKGRIREERPLKTDVKGSLFSPFNVSFPMGSFDPLSAPPLSTSGVRRYPEQTLPISIYLPHLPYSPTSTINRERHSRRGFPNKVRLARPKRGRAKPTVGRCRQPVFARRVNIGYRHYFCGTTWVAKKLATHTFHRVPILFAKLYEISQPMTSICDSLPNRHRDKSHKSYMYYILVRRNLDLWLWTSLGENKYEVCTLKQNTSDIYLILEFQQTP